MKPSELVQEITAAIIAVVTVVGALLITAFQLVNHEPTDVPQWITLLIGAIVGAYFARAAAVNGARQAGTAAAQTAVANAAKAAGGTTDVGITPPVP